MSIFILIVVFGLLFYVGCDEESMLCQQCGGPAAQGYLREFCVSHNSTGDLLLLGCCCVNTKSQPPVITGLDWSSCQLTSISGNLTSQPSLRVLMLDNNTALTTQDGDFQGLTQLLYLSLPDDALCPGGNNSWNATTTTNNSVVCHGELDICITNNLTCPNNNSHCVLSAPGEAECLCNDGLHGYKCLRKGYFPYIDYTAVLCSVTVVIAAFLWCTQRRKVSKDHIH